MFVFLAPDLDHEYEVYDLQNADQIEEENEYKPPFVATLGSSPETIAFESQ
jgi:hypothetical protein